MKLLRHAPRYRRLLAVPAAALVLTVSACGGGDHTAGNTAGHGSDMPGMSGSSTGTSTQAAGAHQMGTYPPVTPGPAAVGEHNDADVAFAEGMIPHHGQAVQMADVILAKTGNAQVKALAERIKQAQTPEIATLSGWLKGWGVAVPDPYAHAAGMAGMQHSGMMSAEQMGQLDKASGTAADTAFLTLMQEHHEGAVEMGTTVLGKGSNLEVKKLAQSIVTSQTAEIAEMKAMVSALG